MNSESAVDGETEGGRPFQTRSGSRMLCVECFVEGCCFPAAQFGLWCLGKAEGARASACIKSTLNS